MAGSEFVGWSESSYRTNVQQVLLRLWEHNYKFHLLSWLPIFLDLKRIKYVWDVLGGLLQAVYRPPRYLRELIDLCLGIWSALPPDIYKKLVESTATYQQPPDIY
ncbi:hypothetical protein AVEN_11739-1 [Araneus ventricosus]|uniref:Uncharacterized protein n=1 Tax=Araneus ventricosus TaxID=182803 RepID=A0A4Y2EQP3_ARAVE|nr:hypothetical protein AVEN_11739-1 [Araneus ventricosus]